MGDINKMKYQSTPSTFRWEGLGNVGEGRVTLGLEMPVLIYRLFQYTLRDILTRELDSEQAADIYRAAGHLAGKQFAEHVLDLSGDFDFFITNLQRVLNELKIGILRVESSDLDNLHFILTVSEDLDCSGLPITGQTVCDYDEGFIAGILEAYSNVKFDVIEIDCWSSGDRTCRFDAKPY